MDIKPIVRILLMTVITQASCRPSQCVGRVISGICDCVSVCVCTREKTA